MYGILPRLMMGSAALRAALVSMAITASTFFWNTSVS